MATVTAWGTSNVMNVNGASRKKTEKMNKKVYIAGKIGEEVPSEATLRKFAKAEEFLQSKGYLVFNPTRSGLGATADVLAKKKGTDFYREIMLLDLDVLAKCDTICMLADWTDSPGATVEYHFAKALGLEIIYKRWDKDE